MNDTYLQELEQRANLGQLTTEDIEMMNTYLDIFHNMEPVADKLLRLLVTSGEARKSKVV
jgi:hypothetical protein